MNVCMNVSAKETINNSVALCHQTFEEEKKSQTEVQFFRRRVIPPFLREGLTLGLEEWGGGEGRGGCLFEQLEAMLIKGAVS